MPVPSTEFNLTKFLVLKCIEVSLNNILTCLKSIIVWPHLRKRRQNEVYFKGLRKTPSRKIIVAPSFFKLKLYNIHFLVVWIWYFWW